jgi:hypothetical protein
MSDRELNLNLYLANTSLADDYPGMFVQATDRKKCQEMLCLVKASSKTTSELHYYGIPFPRADDQTRLEAGFLTRAVLILERPGCP